jgi:hypothetical protein
MRHRVGDAAEDAADTGHPSATDDDEVRVDAFGDIEEGISAPFGKHVQLDRQAGFPQFVEPWLQRLLRCLDDEPRVVPGDLSVE